MLQGAIFYFISEINFWKYRLVVGKDIIKKMFPGDAESDNKLKSKKSLLSLILVLTILAWAFIGSSASGGIGFIVVTILAFLFNNGVTVLIALHDKKAFLEAESQK